VKAKDILQVSAYYPPHLGGQENAVYDLSRQLADAGHRVQVLTSAKGSNRKGVKTEGNVLVRRMRGLVFGHAPIMPLFPVRLFRAAKTNTVVHLHIGQAFTPEMVWLVSKLRRFKYIAELHIDFEPSGPAGVLLPLYKRLILKRVLQSAASVVALNEKTLRIVRNRYGYTGDARILHNGINEDYFTVNRPAADPNPPRILRLLFVGRLSKQKNLPALLEAIATTKRKVYLDVLGDGEEREEIKRAIKAHGLTNVTLHGRQGREEVMKFYKSCDALMMPSLYEAQPLVLLEAMAAGIPIIGTNVIGVADHIKDAGIIVEPTVSGLIDGIERYYRQYSSLPEMIKRGYAAANTFRWRNALKEYESLYEAVVGG
jgi:glycosyltransferase involved in cell wall biosynthesis